MTKNILNARLEPATSKQKGYKMDLVKQLFAYVVMIFTLGFGLSLVMGQSKLAKKYVDFWRRLGKKTFKGFFRLIGAVFVKIGKMLGA